MKLFGERANTAFVNVKMFFDVIVWVTLRLMLTAVSEATGNVF